MRKSMNACGGFGNASQECQVRAQGCEGRWGRRQGCARDKKARLSLLLQRFWGSHNTKKNERLQRLRGCRTGMPGACPSVLGEYVRGGRGQTHEVRCQWLRPGVHKKGYEKRDRSDLLQSFLSLLLGMFIGVRYVQNLPTKVAFLKRRLQVFSDLT